MAKLIYIISTGHSGSTLLDILLGTFENVFSTGEFRYFTWQLYRTKNGKGSVQNEDICTCGSRFQECAIWSEVIKQIEIKNHIDIINNPLNFNTSPLGSFKYHGKTTVKNRFIHKFISMEMLNFQNNIISKIFRESYINEVQNVWQLIDTLGEVTNSEYIVDSTKGLLRFYLLSQYRPNDVYLIVNTRDNYGYAHSFIKRGVPPEISLKMMKRHNSKVEKLLKNNNIQYFSTEYKKVANNPEKILSEVSQFLNLDFKPKQLENINTKNYHLVAGNPMRYKGDMKIIYDNSWNNIDDKIKNEIDIYIKKYNL